MGQTRHYTCSSRWGRGPHRMNDTVCRTFETLERTMRCTFRGRHRGHGHGHSRSDDRQSPPWRREPFGLRTDKANGKLLGVCAGVARRFGISPFMARVLFVLAALPMGLLWLLIPLYILLGLMLDDYGDTPQQDDCRASAHPGRHQHSAPKGHHAATDTPTPPDLRFADLKRQFDDLERRTGSMEREVTSSDFGLKRAFRDLDTPPNQS